MGYCCELITAKTNLYNQYSNSWVGTGQKCTLYKKFWACLVEITEIFLGDDRERDVGQLEQVAEQHLPAWTPGTSTLSCCNARSTPMSYILSWTTVLTGTPESWKRCWKGHQNRKSVTAVVLTIWPLNALICNTPLLLPHGSSDFFSYSVTLLAWGLPNGGVYQILYMVTINFLNQTQKLLVWPVAFRTQVSVDHVHEY